jgi:tagatose kinase
MSGIWTMGELLVEIMRPREGISLDDVGEFVGPFPSGAPAIFIDTVARLGHNAGIIGSVGRDDFGSCILRRLRDDGVDCHLVSERDDRPTGVAFVTYFPDGSRKFLYHIGNSAAEVTQVPSLEGVKEPRFFHVMGCSLLASEPFREAILETLAAFVEKGAKVSFDPNIRPELMRTGSLDRIIGPVMEHCSVLFPGEEEILLLSGASTVEASVERLFENPALELIVVKRGSRGSSIFGRNSRCDVGVYEVEAVDPTGAGDAFDAAFLCAMLESRSLQDCAMFATAAGALTAAAFGPMEGQITPEQMARIMTSGEI